MYKIIGPDKASQPKIGTEKGESHVGAEPDKGGGDQGELFRAGPAIRPGPGAGAGHRPGHVPLGAWPLFWGRGWMRWWPEPWSFGRRPGLSTPTWKNWSKARPGARATITWPTRAATSSALRATLPGPRFCSSQEGLLLHANHCVLPRFQAKDLGRQIFPDSYERLPRLRQFIAPNLGRLTPESMMEVMRDNQGRPNSIRRHPDPEFMPRMGAETLASYLMEPGKGLLHLCLGNPCQNQYKIYQLQGLSYGRSGTGQTRPRPARKKLQPSHVLIQ